MERPDLKYTASGARLQEMGEGMGSSEVNHQMTLKCPA